MLIALSIMVILLSITLPNLLNFYERAEEKLLLSQLLHLLTFAQHEAIVRNSQVILCQSTNQKTCNGNWKDGQLVFIDINEDGKVLNEKQILTVRQGIKVGELNYRGFPFYRPYLLFKADATLANDNGTFWYCRSKNAPPIWAILIAKSGKTRIVYPDKNGNINDKYKKKLAC